jgi:hypothetical protein
VALEATEGDVFRQRNHGPCGPPKVMKNGVYPATALHGSATLPFVIPSAAKGSAVPRTIPGNVFRQSVPGSGWICKSEFSHTL